MKTTKLALFDFDGTITSKDSLVEFVLFHFATLKCFWRLMLYSPVHVFYKLRIISSTTAKNFFLKMFLKNVTVDDYLRMCSEFASQRLPQIIKPEALRRIKWHLDNGDTVAIVSASPEDWIRVWAIRNGIDTVIATKLEIRNGKLSGKISGENCNHNEKVVRVRKHYGNIDQLETFAYGNSRSDRFILAIADHKFYRKFQ